ncbi:MAG: hypothetical protein CM15mP14_3950 [Rhodospirillaceae bacterium]|nr:MAG: hypothetical protein CM15mP14_3950 [Rhodospirillaceae bacterium]
MQTSFRLNGHKVKLHCDPTERLTYALRERLKITGTKVGCNAGDCGACTVIIDGEACCACLVGVGQIDGSEITTVEGLFDEILFLVYSRISRKRSSPMRDLYTRNVGKRRRTDR